MKKYLLITILCLLGYGRISANQTQVLYLSGRGNDSTTDWNFYCSAGRGSGKWTKIPVPSNWECMGFGQYTYGHMPLEDRINETGIYRRYFAVPSSWKGQKIEIVFGGVMTDTEVKINGVAAGPIHKGGFYEFRYDISNLLKFGTKNSIEVTVHKTSSNKSIVMAETKADFWVFGGIFRPVWLESKPVSRIEDFSIDAKADGNIVVSADLAGQVGGCQLKGQVKTLDGKNKGKPFVSDVLSEGTLVLSSSFSDIKTWSAEFPNLYVLELELLKDGSLLHKETSRFGFRTVEVRPMDGVYVNGVRIKMRGVNRHSFWPTSGRTLNDRINLEDALLIKQMNMNAVRCSHYPPERRFLDICDSLGLYVIDELTGWQDAYDTEAGEPLVKEMIRRDKNHPSIIFWANGNEGGFNFDLVDRYSEYDLQKRFVIHPWLEGEIINNFHYPSWNTMYDYLSRSNKIWFPTEFNHGLYDGGHGAGLEDYWSIMQKSDLCAGGFLWDLVDQGLKRDDRNGELDTDGNHGADGILGPYRQKEGSFYAIRDIWSPVQIEGLGILPSSFDGSFVVENRYSFTDLSQCRFEAKLYKVDFPNGISDSLILGITSPDVRPGMKGILKLETPSDGFTSWDYLKIRAFDPAGMMICGWTRNISRTTDLADKLVKEDMSASADLPVSNFRLTEIKAENGSLQVTKDKNGWTELSFKYLKRGFFDNVGVTFDLDDKTIIGVKYLGNGPFRVWKNRLRGVEFGLWKKDYNDTMTGESWDYPEFKGYHSNLYACDIELKKGTLRIVSATDGLFLHLLTPSKQIHRNNDNTIGVFPEGDISILSAISPVGTKFKKASQTGPQGGKNYVEFDEEKRSTHAEGKVYMKYIPNHQ